MTNKFKFRAIMLISMLLSINQVWGATYTKVTSAPTDWSGTYLFVYERSATAGVVFDGITNVTNNYAQATISSGTITSDAEAIADAEVKIIKHSTDEYYTLQSSEGYYFSGVSQKNALNYEETDTAGFSLSISNNKINIIQRGFVSARGFQVFVQKGSASETMYTDSCYNFKIYDKSAQQKFVLYKKQQTCTSTLTTPSVISTGGNQKATLTWEAVSGATKYQVSWNGGAYADATSPYVKNDLVNGTQYSWKVKAIGNGSTICDSEEAIGNVTPSVTWTDYLTECSNDPSISVSPSSITGLGYVFGSTASASTVKTFTVTGSYLESNKVTITAPTGFEVKTSTGNFTDEIELTPNDGSINETISVRLSSGKTVNTYNGDVTVSCSGAGLESKTVALAGEVTKIKLATPVVTATPAVHQITLSWSAVENASSYQLVWNGGSPETVTSPFVKEGLTGGQSYSYSVVAVGSGNYANSDAATGNATAGKATYTVTFMKSGVESSTKQVTEGEQVGSLPTVSGCDDAHTTFIGWSATDFGTTSSAPTLISPTQTITGAVTYYAVFGNGAGSSNTFQKITSIDAFTDGDYVIAGLNESQYYVMKNELYNSNYYVADALTPTNNKYENPDATYIWTLKTTSDGTSIYNSSIERYAALTVGSSTNILRFFTSAVYYTVTYANSSWSIESKQCSGYYLTYYYYNSFAHEFAARTSNDYKMYLFKRQAGCTEWVTTCSNEVNVIYNGNENTGGSVPVDENNPYDKNDEVTVLVNTGSLVKDHYDFDGWNTKADGSGTDRAVGSTFTITANTTLYAKWSPKTYTVAWKVNGTPTTAGSPTTSVTYGQSISALPTAPTSAACDGTKQFVGWTKTAIDGEESEAPSDLFTTAAGAPAISENTTFYAVFANHGESGSKNYELVEASRDDWTGKYLIVEQTLDKCFDGSLTTLDATGNYQSITYVNSETKKTITSTSTVDGYVVNISKSTTAGKYYIKTASDYYIGSTGGATTNELLSSTTEKYNNSISYADAGVTIQGTNSKLQFYYDNSTAYRFRYYGTSATKVRLPKLYRYDWDESYSGYATTCSQKWDITNITANDGGYGSVSPTEVLNIPDQSVVTVSGNTFTVNGTTVTATPTESDAQYTYAFTSWSNIANGDKITADKSDIVANFSRIVNNYNVTATLTNVTAGTAFPAQLPYGGSFSTTISANTGYNLPASISVSGATSNWNASTGELTISDVTGAVTVTISGQIKTYAVTLAKNEDWGTIDPTALADVNHGTAISIDGSDSKILRIGSSTVTATPATNTAQYTYGWTGWTWEPAGATITAATTATANFTRTLNQYTITFENEDGTVLQSGLVNYGETPTYSGATPTKDPTAQYTYTFAGWNPAITTVTAAATYTATYTPATRVYNVGTTLTHVTATPAIPATVEYGGGFSTTITADAGYSLPSTISVAGGTPNWNQSTGSLIVTDVTGDVSITIVGEVATYRSVYLNTTTEWSANSPDFYAHTWGSTTLDPVKMTAVGCQSNVFTASIPVGNTNIIFVRIKPGQPFAWNGDNFWGQTNDLTLEGDKNYFTISGWSDRKGVGNWSTYVPVSFTVSFNKNNGEGDDKASITNIGCQGSALLPTNDWTRTGYDANGWNTAANGSGTHYDDGATITDITANIPLYAEWSSNHPGTVTVSGTYHYWEGETIELTASVQYPERLKPSATYTWKRNGVVVEGQTTNVLSIPSCVFDNAGVYTCTVANGGAESTSSNFGVKILAFVLKNADGSTISTTVLTKPAEGTVVVLPAFNLANENSTYKFCVIDGAGGRFGNDGQMTDKNCTNWAMDKDNDCRILTSGAGNYTFSVDYANIGQPKVSVTYPDHDQAENYPIYFDNSQGWSTDKLYYRIGASTTLCSEAMTLVPGTSRLYTTVTKKYDSFLAWHIGNNCGWTGDNSIYKTKTDDKYAITNSTSFIKSIVGETGVTVTITDQHSIGLSDENNNCEFYETATTAGLMTHTATVTAPMNGTITLNWTDITGTAQKATATTAGLAHTCNLTITATPATGYELTSLTVNGVDFTSGSVHVLDADATIAATFSAASYSVTLNTNGGTINSGNVTSYTYGVGATLPTDVTKSGADFGGWFAESDFSGERVYSIGDSETGNKTFYALWTYLFAYNCNGGTCTGEYSTVCDTYMSVPEGTEMTVTTGTPTKTGYTFDGWQVNGAGDYLHGGDKVTVNQTTELVAHFTAQLVNYTVNHYQQNVDGTYPSSPTDVDNLQAYTGASVTPDRKDYGTGFNTPSGKQVTIAGDGSTVVNYQYSRTTHTITWTLDDGFDTQWYKQTSIRYGAQPTYKSSDPATSDCDYERVFVGWLDHKIAWDAREASAPTGMFQKESAPTVSGDANYYAVFANYAEEVYSNYATACVKKYVITGFSDANGNSITADYEQAAAGETVTLTVTTADGWKNKSYSVVKTTSQSTIVEVTDNQFTMPAYDVTVKATFVPVHRVFFHVPSGGCITAPTTIELETSEVVPTLPAPTGTIPGGWTFAGWSLTEVTTESTTMPNLMYSGGYLENDVDVYALYQKAGTETLTFDQFLSGSTYNSAYFVISSLYSTAEHALPNTTSISSGKIASTTITSVSDGMVTNASEIAATKMLFRKISSTEVQIMNVNNMFLDGKDGNLKLSTTAVTWTKGGSGTQANPVRFTINSKALRINSTNEYGHYAASATQVNDTKILAISNNTVYYLTDADCIEKWYVTYDANGGETTCESGKKVAEGFTICADAPTRDHYTFGGWSDGVSTYDAGAAYSLTKNVTFTAQWTLVQHTVTFNNNGVTLDEGGTRQVGYGTAVGALPQLTEDQAVDCNGRSVIFMGWMEGEIDPRDDNPTITYITPSTVIDGNKTYNAVWAEGVEEEVEP